MAIKHIDKNNLGYLGIEFQYKLAKIFVEEADFFRDVVTIVDQNAFNDSLLRTFIGILKDYYSKSGVTPSYDMLNILLREKAKTNNSGTTSLPNSAIQNSSHLTRVDKHNYRKYDNEAEDIVIVRGTTSLVDDVKNLYKQEFQKSVDEYNSIQVREDRKIKDYFTNVSNNTKNDLACEIIIELGDKEYWDTKDDEFKSKMSEVYRKQVNDLELLVPNFKVASAIIHYDETSPHMHIVGVPIKYKNKNGMEKQVGKSDVFTKESLIT